MKKLFSNTIEQTLTTSEIEDLFYKNQFLEYMINHMENLMFIVSRNNDIVYVNDAVVLKYGYSREELLQMKLMNIDMMYKPDDMENFWEIFAKEKVLKFSSMHKDKEGNLYPVKIHTHYIDYQGQQYSFGIIEDERYIQNLLDAQNDILVMTNETEMLAGNSAMLEFFEYKTFENFHKEHQCICDFFIDEEGYLPSNLQWVSYIIQMKEENNKVKMKHLATGKNHIFMAKVTPFDSYRYLISFNDITELEQYKAELEKLSITDSLTTLYNRRYFIDQIPQEINRTKRYGKMIGFIMFDIDFFKQYNDTYGHQKGDEVLSEIALTCKNIFSRASDFCFRLGGEEFGVFLSVDSYESLQKEAEKLRSGIENLHIQHSKSSIADFITISVGAILSEGNPSIEELYSKADNQMYKAKENGRNRVFLDQEVY